MNIKHAHMLIQEFDHGRDMDAVTTLQQVGKGNVWAISGGRVIKGHHMVAMPVSSGYWVTITLDANDTYTVRRVFVRGSKVTVKKVNDGIYCDNLGEVAYQASCYMN